MKLGDAFPGKWLKASDLDDEDHTVTIKDVRSEMIGQGQQAQLKLIMEFEEFTEKALVVNKTNATTIAKVLGSEETDDWVGKQITLWVNPDVQFGGETVSAIRVRNRTKANGGKANGLLSFAEAVALCQKNGIDESQLKDYLRTHGLSAYNPAKCTPLVRQLVSLSEPITDADEDISF